MTTDLSGNTKPSSSFKARAFHIVLNQVDKYEDFKNEFTRLKSMDYFLSAKEKAPKTGHEHIHMFIHFTAAYRLNQRILSYGAHIEIAHGSPKQNIEYISKDGNILDTIGEPPHQGRTMSIRELKDANIDEVDPHLFRIKRQLDEEKKDLDTFMGMLTEIEADDLKAPNIIYITGGTGKGKTYTAYKRALRDYPKEQIGKLTIHHDFIDVINDNAKCYVIEEFRDNQMKATDFLQLIDKYGYRANTKGGFKTLRPECIIICSIIQANDIYSDETNDQFMRRITEFIDLDINESI